MQATIEAYSSTVSVYKYSDTGTPNPYGQRARTFAVAVPVLGHVAYDPTKEMLTQIGEEGEASGMITFSRATLEAALPALNPETFVNDSDEVAIDGKRWRVIGIHLTGRLSTVHDIIVVTFDTIPGREGETS